MISKKIHKIVIAKGGSKIFFSFHVTKKNIWLKAEKPHPIHQVLENYQSAYKILNC